MISNFLCETCSKVSVCKVMDILVKFHEDAKKPLGVSITMNQCTHYDEDPGSEGQ